MPKITKRVVDGLKPDPAGEVFTWDTEIKGFGVRVMPSGVASYIVKYRTAEGRQRRLAFARVGTVTPDEARKTAAEKLGAAAKGEDPSADRNRIRHAPTVTELCDLYLADAAVRIKASTLAMDRSRIECHVKPLIGARKIPALTSDDVEKMRTDIEAGKTAKPRMGNGGVTTGGAGVASRTIGMLGTIMEFAIRKKFIVTNPARGVWRKPDGKQDRFLDPAEIARFGQALRDALDDGETATGIATLKFLLLTGLRRVEAASLPRKSLDVRCNCIRFVDTKGGRQLRAIGTVAFEGLPKPKASEWVFPGDRGKNHFVGLPKVLARMCARAGLEGVTIHVLRHTFAATAAEMGYSELMIGGLLGHKLSGVTVRYAHMPDPALVAAAEKVSARIAERLAA
ncbi:tyrosine-type recombinase/integrase [Methylobacterium haplocladii]|uniref:Integrase n=1 Tax=Methylobacterium haplocladii TaxID=1176176 RepID=A0A512IP81_9HYPH|nr:site-specific integrase [Methylobacterium haplocladii]GEO99521.1 integrase [Methylobacterium haplocladii]GJD83664.1 Tyrosine recombinase XerC [Methylobacterium haplocladii]GLS59740.1 integrase [Methylobacterium haplocladii]